MRVLRLVAAPFAKQAFVGEGARVAGGRWNPKGVPVVYTAASLALAALELLVHTDDDLLPTDLVTSRCRTNRSRIPLTLHPGYACFTS